MKEWRRLPENDRTQDVDEYLNAWKKVGDPCAKILGMNLVAFDPGFSFDDETNYLQLSYYVAKRIVELHEAAIIKAQEEARSTCVGWPGVPPSVIAAAYNNGLIYEEANSYLCYNLHDNKRDK